MAQGRDGSHCADGSAPARPAERRVDGPRAVWGTVLLAAITAVGGVASAQGYRDFRSPSFRDFQLVRNRPYHYVEALTLRAGASGTMPGDEDPVVGREETYAPDGFAWYHSDSFTSEGLGFDAYVGRDGAIAVLQQGGMTDGGGGGRLELSTRYFPFYREGFYRRDDWLPTGRYEGRDYGIYGGISTPLDEQAMFEFGLFYRRNSFEANETTGAGYRIPEDYAAYGARVYFEQSTLRLAQQTGLPSDGFLATIKVEYERNTADDAFGTDLWTSRLPSGLVRGAFHLEWYFPTDGSSVWELRLDASMSDEQDRVHIFDATKPIGVWWADAELGYRLGFGQSLHLTPFGNLQFTRTLDELGVDDEDDFWLGGGLRARFELADSISLLADYSYLSNANRPSISYDEDVYGEHQFFAGIEVRIGASRF